MGVLLRRFRTRRPRKRVSSQAWHRTGKTLLLLAIVCGVFGLLLGAVPTEPEQGAVDPQAVPFWITRGCFVAPGLVLLFLGYMSLVAARRRERQVHCTEIAVVLGVAASLLPLLVGMSVAFQPATESWVRIMGALLCLWPGLFSLGLVGLFWALVVRRKRSPV